MEFAIWIIFAVVALAFDLIMGWWKRQQRTGDAQRELERIFGQVEEDPSTYSEYEDPYSGEQHAPPHDGSAQPEYQFESVGAGDTSIETFETYDADVHVRDVLEQPTIRERNIERIRVSSQRADDRATEYAAERARDHNAERERLPHQVRDKPFDVLYARRERDSSPVQSQVRRRVNHHAPPVVSRTEARTARLVLNPVTARQAIILMEVLGPPKGLV